VLSGRFFAIWHLWSVRANFERCFSFKKLQLASPHSHCELPPKASQFWQNLITFYTKKRQYFLHWEWQFRENFQSGAKERWVPPLIWNVLPLWFDQRTSERSNHTSRCIDYTVQLRLVIDVSRAYRLIPHAAHFLSHLTVSFMASYAFSLGSSFRNIRQTPNKPKIKK